MVTEDNIKKFRNRDPIGAKQATLRRKLLAAGYGHKNRSRGINFSKVAEKIGLESSTLSLYFTRNCPTWVYEKIMTEIINNKN